MHRSRALEITALFLALLVLGACRRSPPEAEERRPGASASAPAQMPVVPEAPYRFVAPERLVAIGDLHGDLAVTRAALRLAGAISSEDDWIGGRLVVVQTGDQLDRGDDDRKILDLLDSLADKARRAGGAVHALNGNHETMNVAGDFRYATMGGLLGFDDFSAAPEATKLVAFDPRTRGRLVAFTPRGTYARRLAQRNVIAIVGDTLFVHGGVSPEHVRYGIGRINSEISRWMRGDAPEPKDLLASDDSPLWTRIYGTGELDAATCRRLGEALELAGARRMVIGHTVQESGINAQCDGRLERIDVGLSGYYGSRSVQVLEINGDKVRVLTGDRNKLLGENSNAKAPRASRPLEASP